MPALLHCGCVFCFSEFELLLVFVAVEKMNIFGWCGTHQYRKGILRAIRNESFKLI